MYSFRSDSIVRVNSKKPFFCPRDSHCPFRNDPTCSVSSVSGFSPNGSEEKYSSPMNSWRMPGVT